MRIQYTLEEIKRHRKPMLLSSKGSVEQYPEGFLQEEISGGCESPEHW